MFCRCGKHRQLVVLRINHRHKTIRHRLYHELSFARTGKPEHVLEYHHSSCGGASSVSLDSTAAAVRVQVHHVPWNPADVNTVQGNYASPYDDGDDAKILNLRKSRIVPERIVAGSEGYGRILEVNMLDKDETVKNDTADPPSFKVGDWVTFALPGLGTLRSSLWLPPEAVLPIRRGAELFDNNTQQVAAVSMLFQLGGTALRMLSDFHPLQPGDVVLQNAGNSGVAFLASQLAKRMMQQVLVMTMVRRGQKTPEEMDALVHHLVSVGQADLVVVEEDVINNREANQTVKAQLKALGASKPPALALNAVGGDSSSVLQQLLGKSGTLVTYGGMSMKPVSIATSQLIFKDIKAVGYWNSRWMAQKASMVEKQAMMDNLVDAFLDDKLQLPPAQVFSLKDYQDALQFAAEQSKAVIRSKTVFNCRQPLSDC